MTHSLRLTDGNTTLDFTDGSNYTLVNFTPNAARMNLDAQAIFDQGSFEPVQETIDLYVEGDDKAEVSDNVQAIQTMLSTAQHHHANGVDSPVFLQLKIDDIDTVYWETEVFGGYVQESETTLAEWSNVKAEVSVFLERIYYWERDLTEQVTLTSAAGSADGNGFATVYNSDNTATSTQNWVNIAKTQIKGSLPTPAKIIIQNETGGNIGWRNFYISNNVFNNPAGFNPWLRDDQLDVGSATVNWASASSHNTIRWSWDIYDSIVPADTYRVIGCFSDMSSNEFLKARAQSSIGAIRADLMDNDEIATGSIGNELIDFGTVPLSPIGKGRDYDGLGLSISARGAGSGGGTLEWVQLMQASSFRHIYQNGYTLSDGGQIVDNGIDKSLYAGTDGSEHNPIVYGYHQPIHLWPGRLQKIYILFDEGSGAFVSGRKIKVAVYYRRRRLTI